MHSVVHEIGCRTILSPSRIPGIDYTVNPYRGCLHGCVYCYAQFMHLNQKRALGWGSFCDIKINAASIFRKQIIHAKPGLISLSTVTDAYQSVEKKYKLTRHILESLLHLKFSISILTKSDLILRDLDLLKQFPRDRCSVGFSLTAYDDRISRLFEPGASPSSDRINAIKILYASGIRTWIFLAPVLPVFTIRDYEPLFLSIRGYVDYILVDSLNIKHGLPNRFLSVLRTHFKPQMNTWLPVISDRAAKIHYDREILTGINRMVKRLGLELQ